MTYDEALRWLYALQPRGIRLELDRMQRALHLRGDPQRELRVVHVAGTNGKGSTCAMIESALRASGARVGLYTSPHLHSFTERIRIDGAPIARDEVARRVTDVRAMLSQEGAPELTFFEVATLIAIEAFRDAQCDVVVLEVGLGGRLDATNVIERPLVTAITGIAMDHQAYLGGTIEEIAAEKAGILKGGVSAVVGRVSPEVRAVIAARAAEVGARVSWVGREIVTETEAETVAETETETDTVTASVPASASASAPASAFASAPASAFSIRVRDHLVDRLTLTLDGAHQRHNAAVAVGVLVELGVEDAAIRRGLAEARWPGRLERIENAIVDAAHNPDGAQALAAHLSTLPRTGPRVLVFGAMSDKPWRDMLALLAPEIDHVVAVAPAIPRAERAEVIAAHTRGELAATIPAGVDRARALAGERGLVIVAGSIFVLAEARAHLLGIETEPAIPM